MNSLDSFPPRPWISSGLLAILLGWVQGCYSIEPDEIDIADEASDEEATDGPGDGDESGGSTTDGDGDGDGDGDTTGDGDGDTGDGDGTDDADATGSDSLTSTGTESDTGDPRMCLDGDELIVGENPISVADGASDLESACGGVADETFYSFTAPSAGDYQFSLTGLDFSGFLYLVDGECAEIADACTDADTPLVVPLLDGETVVIVVDSDAGPGAGTLVIVSL